MEWKQRLQHGIKDARYRHLKALNDKLKWGTVDVEEIVGVEGMELLFEEMRGDEVFKEIVENIINECRRVKPEFMGNKLNSVVLLNVFNRQENKKEIYKQAVLENRVKTVPIPSLTFNVPKISSFYISLPVDLTPLQKYLLEEFFEKSSSVESFVSLSFEILFNRLLSNVDSMLFLGEPKLMSVFNKALMNDETIDTTLHCLSLLIRRIEKDVALNEVEVKDLDKALHYFSHNIFHQLMPLTRINRFMFRILLIVERLIPWLSFYVKSTEMHEDYLQGIMDVYINVLDYLTEENKELMVLVNCSNVIKRLATVGGFDCCNVLKRLMKYELVVKITRKRMRLNLIKEDNQEMLCLMDFQDLMSPVEEDRKEAVRRLVKTESVMNNSWNVLIEDAYVEPIKINGVDKVNNLKSYLESLESFDERSLGSICVYLSNNNKDCEGNELLVEIFNQNVETILSSSISEISLILECLIYLFPLINVNRVITKIKCLLFHGDLMIRNRMVKLVRKTIEGLKIDVDGEFYEFKNYLMNEQVYFDRIMTSKSHLECHEAINEYKSVLYVIDPNGGLMNRNIVKILDKFFNVIPVSVNDFKLLRHICWFLINQIELKKIEGEFIEITKVLNVVEELIKDKKQPMVYVEDLSVEWKLTLDDLSELLFKIKRNKKSSNDFKRIKKFIEFSLNDDFTLFHLNMWGLLINSNFDDASFINDYLIKSNDNLTRPIPKRIIFAFCCLFRFDQGIPIELISSFLSIEMVNILAWNILSKLLKFELKSIFENIPDIIDSSLKCFLDSLNPINLRISSLNFILKLASFLTDEEKIELVKVFEKFNLFVYAKEINNISLLKPIACLFHCYPCNEHLNSLINHFIDSTDSSIDSSFDKLVASLCCSSNPDYFKLKPLIQKTLFIPLIIKLYETDLLNLIQTLDTSSLYSQPISLQFLHLIKLEIKSNNFNNLNLMKNLFKNLINEFSSFDEQFKQSILECISLLRDHLLQDLLNSNFLDYISDLIIHSKNIDLNFYLNFIISITYNQISIKLKLGNLQNKLIELIKVSNNELAFKTLLNLIKNCSENKKNLINSNFIDFCLGQLESKSTLVEYLIDMFSSLSLDQDCLICLLKTNLFNICYSFLKNATKSQRDASLQLKKKKAKYFLEYIALVARFKDTTNLFIKNHGNFISFSLIDFVSIIFDVLHFCSLREIQIISCKILVTLASFKELKSHFISLEHFIPIVESLLNTQDTQLVHLTTMKSFLKNHNFGDKLNSISTANNQQTISPIQKLLTI
ncbi:hypothetical protein ROZALSC1DRAFT_29820 [Rozella allomycis CSF55]|uniref:Uncharacterized protein n=1 Tax=Rozella allomycis (strain CSF55) TaxID=988480 RepID=A0A4V1IZL8_ROZAC|nr:hypothetical protein ROZALSC1DRAFT_29820 [Rozella allomycis CSF55]